MGQTNIQSMRGDNPNASSAVIIINHIITTINHSGNRKPGTTLYLGEKQRRAIQQIDWRSRSLYNHPDAFFGWPVIWVKKESYIKLAI